MLSLRQKLEQFKLTQSLFLPLSSYSSTSLIFPMLPQTLLFYSSSIFSFIEFSSNIFSHHIHKHSMFLHSLFHRSLLLHSLYLCSLLLRFLYTMLLHNHIQIQYFLITLYMLYSLKKHPLLSLPSQSNYYNSHKNHPSFAFMIDRHAVIHLDLLCIEIYNCSCV